MDTPLDTLKQFIRDEIGFDGDIDPETDLLETKILDSFNVVEMAGFVQERFDLELEGDDLVRENFSTLSALLALITAAVVGVVVGYFFVTYLARSAEPRAGADHVAEPAGEQDEERREERHRRQDRPRHGHARLLAVAARAAHPHPAEHHGDRDASR